VASGVLLHALEDDLALHGIDAPDERIRCVDFSDWVALASECTQQMSWR
jgi:sulfur transfer complex TusBCD TusB component (DsrH family)